MPTIDIQALSVGAIGVNSLGADFTNPACTVIDNNDNWGRTLGAAEKYLQAVAPNTDYLLTTVAEWRDVEVEFWDRVCLIFFRITADGKALRLFLNENLNSLTLTARADITTPPGVYQGEGTSFLGTSWTLTDLAGYVDTPANRLWTFGVEGFDFYAKINGVEVLRYAQPYHVLSGKVAVRSHPTPDFGLTNFTVTGISETALFSDPDNAVYDTRDFGIKEVQTTGSITGGAFALTVASPTDFAIGDEIIVEIGGESGLGVRGTKGVGGNFPPLSYADTTARDADLSQINGTWCWVEDTGRMFWWDDAPELWQRGTPLPDYYWALTLPYALTAEITNIVGNVLTLDTAANVTATNANVYHNNYRALTFFSSLESYLWEPRTLDIPAGNYAYHRSGESNLGTVALTVEIRGQGMNETTLFAPNGALSFTISFQSPATDCSVHDLTHAGNFGDYGLRFSDLGTPEVSLAGRPGWAFHQGVFFDAANGSTCYNVRTGDFPGSCIEGAHQISLTVNNCATYSSDPLRRYLANWAFQCSDSEATPDGAITYTDCTFTCPGFHNAYETFRSKGVIYRRCTSVNGIVSSNASGLFLFDEFNITMQEGCAELCNYIDSYGVPTVAVNPYENPIMQANSNIEPPDESMELGGVIRNPTIIIEGPADDAGHTWSAGIIVNFLNPNLRIIADPPWTERPCDAPLTGGYFRGPDYDPLVSPSHSGSLGVLGTGDNLIVEGIRVEGLGSITGNIAAGGNPIQAIVKCVADSIFGTAVQIGNITNAEWKVACVLNDGGGSIPVTVDARDGGYSRMGI